MSYRRSYSSDIFAIKRLPAGSVPYRLAKCLFTATLFTIQALSERESLQPMVYKRRCTTTVSRKQSAKHGTPD
jgi:hypothetical protein